jgi:hypothetical protein
MIRTEIPCPVCTHSTLTPGEFLQASDECKTTYPGVHKGTCPTCGFATQIHCIGSHEQRDFFLTAEEAREEDRRRQEARAQR